MIHTYTEDDVRQAITPLQVARELPAAFRALVAGDLRIQPRQRQECAGVKLSSMGAVWASRRLAACKTYTTVGGQFNFLVNLFDIASGEHHVMPAGELTRVRTAAMTTWVAGQCVRRSPGARKLALFGMGVQGTAHLAALQEDIGFSSIDVVDTADVSRRCESWSRELGVPVRQTAAPQAVDGADLVVTATRSKTALFDGGLLKPGAVVCAVGVSTADGSEIDRTTRQRAGRVIVEWKPQSLLEAGDVVQGLADASLSPQAILDLPQILGHHGSWRVDPDEIILFKAVGVGLSDLVAAHAVARARKADRDGGAVLALAEDAQA